MISVVIPAYDAGRFINRTIDSVLAQSLPADEIIVVDDGSTDDTADVVKSCGPKVRYIYQQNAGVSVARNTGIENAGCEWITFLDADDEWLPDKLERQCNLLTRNPQLCWCACNFLITTGTESLPRLNIKAARKALAGNDYIENYLVEAGKGLCHIATPAVMIHKSLFQQLGGFEPGRAHGEDLDMWSRIAHYYPRIGFIAEPLAVVHLDIANHASASRRIESKKGADDREIIARHLELSKEAGDFLQFRPYAFRILRRILLTTLFNGYNEDARKTVAQFRNMFPWYWRMGAYILSTFPKATSAAAKSAAYLTYKLGLERQITRRWLRGKKTNTK
jgi:glycosyltransferase involved in cell wall biosynthesis